MDTPGLTFDPGPHIYAFNGVPAPSVTQMLSGVGLPDLSKIPEENLKIGQERGTKVHKLTEYWDKQNLDESALSESGLIYLSQWRRAWEVLGCPIWTGIEIHLYADGFAGTPDRFYIDYAKKWCLLADLKTGVDLMAVGPQTAGYEILIRKNFPTVRKVKRVSIRLDIDRKEPKIEELKDPVDAAVFQSALNITRFKQKKGGIV